MTFLGAARHGAQVSRQPFEVLFKRAVRHYNDYHGMRGDFDKHASVHDSPEFLAHIAQNYLRHEPTDYEEHLYRLFGKVGTEQAYQRLRHRMDKAISKVCPAL
jgi:hypothetical protein